MHYVAFLILWLPQPADKPPAAAFLAKFDTHAQCMEKIRQVDLPPEVKQHLSCILTVVDPKHGIKE
jgi:hypothetical protein